jgi:uncharacterized protein (TIGR00375 family)
MKVIADLHMHGKYSRATSIHLTIPNLTKFARIKGLSLMGTGDFTHPLWLEELKKGLTEDGTGILKDKDGFGFILSGEISSIYSQGGKVRRVHNIVLARSFEVAEQINEALTKRKVNLRSDGRPICGIPCPELVEIILGADKEAEVIPAHAWTPWFSVFGSESGFDDIQDCYKDQTRHIHALETGLSSDPAMNWRLSSLDKYTLLSNSDSHSFWPWRIGREANVFELNSLTYKDLLSAIREKDPRRFLHTVETSPSYGKYHFDGHRACQVSLSPEEARKLGNVCPVCKRPLTIGVLHRVEELADRPEGYVPKHAIPFKSLIPLTEIIGGQMGIDQLYSKKVWAVYNSLIKAFGSEFAVLLEADLQGLSKVVDQKLAKAIVDVRGGKVEIRPGYDGVYGYPIFEGVDKERVEKRAEKERVSLDKNAQEEARDALDKARVSGRKSKKEAVHKGQKRLGDF